MAGRRQHYIPCFLQRGFLDVSDSKADRTWLHRRGVNPRLVGIRQVGVGEYFYSKLSGGEEQTLDELITEFEGDLDGYLYAIKSAPVGQQIDANIAACLVAHLAIRTNHARSIFRSGMSQIIDKMTSLLADSNSIRTLLGVDAPSAITKLTTPINNAFDVLPLEQCSLPPALSKRMLSFYVRELFDNFYKNVQPDVAQKIDELANSIPNVIRDAHNKALMKMEHSTWENKLSQFFWKTFSVSGAILPDCVVLVGEQNGTIIPLLLSSPDKIELVILPISHNKILVGSCDAIFDVNIESINMSAAECSDNFFISHENNDHIGLSHLIGMRCENSINAIVKESISDWFENSPSKSFDVKKDKIDNNVSQPFSFSVACIGFADSGTANKLGCIIKTIVQELGRSMPLYSIDGFTFAVDYENALKNLDRGDPNLTPDWTQQPSYGWGIAKCVSVKRENGIKNHIVIDSVIAVNLLCDDVNDRTSSLHVIVTMLSHIAHEACYEATLNYENFVPDEFARLFHEAVSRAPSNYFSAKQSAFWDANAGLRYADLLCNSIKAAHEVILSARLTYRENGDLDGLLKIAVSQVSFIVGHAAQWIGHRDGTPEQDDCYGMQLLEELKTFGLDSWIVLFGRDLSRLYDAEGGFNEVNIYALDRHVERLLWMFQIFPWPMEDGHVYVNVLMGNDAQLLNSL